MMLGIKSKHILLLDCYLSMYIQIYKSTGFLHIKCVFPTEHLSVEDEQWHSNLRVSTGVFFPT